MSAPVAVFEARGLSKRFGRFTALSEVSLRLEPGEVLALLGRNGAGKTTFLQLAATLMRPSAGQLLYQDRTASEAPEEVRRGIGFLCHASFLYQDLTARENLEFYARLYSVPDRRTAVEEGLARAGLAARAESPVRSLSRGMQQRLAIARALLHRPTLLLLDEPYTGLDTDSAERLSRQLETFRGSASAAILTTHELERGLELADRVAILERGRLVYQGKGKQEPAQFRRTFAELTRSG